MTNRAGKEFPSHVIETAFRRASGSCERCGSKENLEVHHLLPIHIANSHFPSLAAWVIKSTANAEVLCSSCHDRVDHYGDWEFFNRQALILLEMMGKDFF